MKPRWLESAFSRVIGETREPSRNDGLRIENDGAKSHDRLHGRPNQGFLITLTAQGKFVANSRDAAPKSTTNVGCSFAELRPQ